MEAAGDLMLAVDHVGVAVPDLEQAVRWYTQTLGLRLLHTEENSGQSVVEAMLGGPDAPGGTELQLVAPLTPDSPVARFLDRRGAGLHHVAYQVADADEAAEILRTRGVRLLYDFARPGTRGSRINFLHPKDAGGVLIELVESATTRR